MSLGRAIVMSGPSGAGKSTVCNILLERDSKLKFSVSCTTRAPREGEVNGVHYHFLSKEEFESRIEQGDLLEYAEVHGNYYGTLKSAVLDQTQQGFDVLIDIDVQGMRLIRRACKQDKDLDRACMFVFFAPPSYDELVKRLTGRGTESEESLNKRLANAKGEMAAWCEYDFLVMNHNPEQAAKDLDCVIQADKMRTSEMVMPEGWPSE